MPVADMLEQLGRFPVILPTAGTAIRHAADGFFLSRGLATPQRTLETLSVSVARGYALQGDAVWVSPWGAARPDIESGGLCALPVNMAGTEEQVGLTLQADRVPTAAEAALMALIRQVAALR